MKDSCNILIVGVGGQGTLLTSRILGTLARRLGFDVKVSEVHGMAQRGGSVVTYVRMGRDVASPLIEENGADFMVSFELMEALRYVHLVKKGGAVVTSTQQISPMPVITGTAEYPRDILEKLKASGASVDAVDALDIARQLGNIRVVNTLMLGRLARLTGFNREDWLASIQECVPAKTIDLNVTAFQTGYDMNA